MWAKGEVGCQGESRAGAHPALGPESGLRGTLDAPTPDSRSCPSQLHTLASALPSPHMGVFQLLGMSPECLWSSGWPVAVGARGQCPPGGPFAVKLPIFQMDRLWLV